MVNFSGSGHPVLCASSAFERGESRSKAGSKKSVHFGGSHENIELLLRTVISANQLSVYGAIADFCNEVPKDLRAPGKPAAPDHLKKEKMEIPADLYCRKFYQCTAVEKPSARIRAKIRTIVRRPEIIQLCSDAGLKLVEQGQYFYTLDTEDGQQMQHLFIPRIHDASQ